MYKCNCAAFGGATGAATSTGQPAAGTGLFGGTSSGLCSILALGILAVHVPVCASGMLLTQYLEMCWTFYQMFSIDAF